MTYQLIDSGNFQKLEKFGKYTLIRPCSAAIWRPKFDDWKSDARFTREDKWQFFKKIDPYWTLELEGIIFKLSLTEFGHLGLFPEHASMWGKMRHMLEEDVRLLNLFAYSGGATMVAAQEKAKVCHLDASNPMIKWARENATLNHLEKAPIRWICEDVLKFLKREKKRQSFYDAIILDPPSFGRGNKNEVFKIEDKILELMQSVRDVLSEKPLFVIFSCHTPSFTPLVLEHLAQDMLPKGSIESGEMIISSENSYDLPCGSYMIWSTNGHN